MPKASASDVQQHEEPLQPPSVLSNEVLLLTCGVRQYWHSHEYCLQMSTLTSPSAAFTCGSGLVFHLNMLCMTKRKTDVFTTLDVAAGFKIAHEQAWIATPDLLEQVCVSGACPGTRLASIAFSCIVPKQKFLVADP